MDVAGVFGEVGLTGGAWATPVIGGPGVGFRPNDLVAPASVMKIQIALTVETQIATGSLDGRARRVLKRQDRTPGPVGTSLMSDDVSMSVRDLVVAMLTLSDNVATDELLSLVGLDAVNETTRRLGMTRTRIVSDIRTTLDEIAHDLGFSDYQTMSGHEPESGPPSEDEIDGRLVNSAALDPNRGTRTTAAETVALLQAIWTDRGGPPQACAVVRRRMSEQLTRHRIAAAFAPPIVVAAKSGGLMGVVRNEAGVVTFPEGDAYAVAVFSRSRPGEVEPARTDACIGRVARLLVDQLRPQ